MYTHMYKHIISFSIYLYLYIYIYTHCVQVLVMIILVVIIYIYIYTRMYALMHERVYVGNVINALSAMAEGKKRPTI